MLHGHLWRVRVRVTNNLFLVSYFTDEVTANDWYRAMRDGPIVVAVRSKQLDYVVDRIATADDEDWRRLFAMLTDGGYGRYWKELLARLRDCIHGH